MGCAKVEWREILGMNPFPNVFALEASGIMEEEVGGWCSGWSVVRAGQPKADSTYQYSCQYQYVCLLRLDSFIPFITFNNLI